MTPIRIPSHLKTQSPTFCSFLGESARQFSWLRRQSGRRTGIPSALTRPARAKIPAANSHLTAILCALGLSLASVLYIGCATGTIPATGERRHVGFTWEQEREIGKQANREVASLFGIYRDARLERYVTEVGQRVLAQSHLRRPGAEEQFRNTPVTFGVLDSPIVNAMALPGGHIYVTRGMLAHLNSEDQLAVILAHEIGHITARHAARRAWQEQIAQGLLLGGAILGQEVFGASAQQIVNLGGMAAQVISLRYSREDELEADKLGVEYSSLAGYDARKVIEFFRSLNRITQKEGQGLPNFLSTHPNPGDRIQRIKDLAELLPAPPARTAVTKNYYDAIEGIVLGEDPRQGFVERNVFYHPELHFRFPVPPNFKVINQPAQVMMVENQNRAILGFSSTAEQSLESAVSRFISQSGLRVIETVGNRSHGLPSTAVVADGKMANGQVIRLMAYFVQHRGRIYNFVGYTSPQAFASFRNRFLQTMEGFSELDDPRILTRQPVRLELQRATRSAPFQVLVPRSVPGEMRPDDLAILNQLNLNDQVERGQILKLPKIS
ncbi:MAG: M48 family metalloprotease [Candidatus Binatia bacterium]